MEGFGRHITVAAAAFALSGCSFFLLSYLRDKVPAVESSIEPNTTSTKYTERLISSATKDCSSAVKKPRKQVRFMEVKDEPNKPGKAKDSGGKSNLKRDDLIIVTCWTNERKQRVSLPENWRSLYNGMKRYRSQQATQTMYA
ncbi:hypothetical protein Pfo_009979 [Paulownia fortunei]|nr:hypothetical protein Pfo_009979 [Paulownia fortunei]